MLEEVRKAIINIRFKLTHDRVVVSKLADALFEEARKLSIEDLRRVQTLFFVDAEEASMIQDVIHAFIIGTEDNIVFQREVLMERLRLRRLRIRASVRVKQARQETVVVESGRHMIARIEVADVE